MTDPAGNRASLDGLASGIGIAAGAKAAGVITVNVGGIATVMYAARDITFAAGDRVAYIRTGNIAVVVARLDTAATGGDPDNPSPTPPPPKPATVTGTKVLTPIETCSRKSGAWRTDTDDVYQGQYGGQGNHIGAAFYGNGPRALSGATITAAYVQLRRRSAGGTSAAQDTTFRLVAEKTRPAGSPTLGSSTDGPNLRWGEATRFALPTSWGQALVDGTAGGLAIYESDGAPYVILDGRGHYSASFQLTLKWTR